jgi:hypothetical protein
LHIHLCSFNWANYIFCCHFKHDILLTGQKTTSETTLEQAIKEKDFRIQVSKLCLNANIKAS